MCAGVRWRGLCGVDMAGGKTRPPSTPPKTRKYSFVLPVEKGAHGKVSKIEKKNFLGGVGSGAGRWQVRLFLQMPTPRHHLWGVTARVCALGRCEKSPRTMVRPPRSKDLEYRVKVQAPPFFLATRFLNFDVFYVFLNFLNF